MCGSAAWATGHDGARTIDGMSGPFQRSAQAGRSGPPQWKRAMATLVARL